MIKLENLPEVTDRALDGLKANHQLKTKILNASLREEKPFVFKKRPALIPVALSCVALMVICVFLLNGKMALHSEKQPLIHSFTAGSADAPSVSFDAFAEMDSSIVQRVEITSAGKAEGPDQLDPLLDALKNHSDLIEGADITMNDQMNIFGSDGLLFSLPVENPYIAWADGVRKCDLFFQWFEETAD